MEMNRREALTAGLGILTAAGINGEIATITAKNIKAFVVTAPKRLSMLQRNVFLEEWNEAFKGTSIEGVPVICMSGGMQLSVVEDAEAK